MSKKNLFKAPYTVRNGTPKMLKDKEGNTLLICPFCAVPHALTPNVPSQCGTRLILTAEQVVFRAKADKRFICVKCGKGGGEMVRFQNAYIHTHNCSPGVVTMTEPPRFSRMAGLVSKVRNERIRKSIERFTGRAMPVDEVREDGTRTGVVLGHFFHKEVKHAEHKPVGA